MRQEIQEKIEETGGQVATFIHPDAVIGCDVEIGRGSVVMVGTVTIGTGTWIGAVVSNNVEIQGNCMIGAGAVVVGDLKEAGVYLGIPAEKR